MSAKGHRRGYPFPVLPGSARPPDAVGLTWLVTVRWTVLVAATGALFAGRTGLGVSLSAPTALLLLIAVAASNLWLTWRIRTSRFSAGSPAGRATRGTPDAAAGLLVCADVLLLLWVLWRSGGALNPASIFFLVQIVLAALVLGRVWTWVVTGLSVGGFGLLYLAPASELRAAQIMHPEIGAHMNGMWLAFAATALVIAVLVTQLVVTIERRDRALEILRDQHARSTRFAGLATLAAGAAHELSTPLATMAVAARELERSLERSNAPGRGEANANGHGEANAELLNAANAEISNAANAELLKDARLIRAEIDRARRILTDLSAQSGGAPGEAPRSASMTDVFSAVQAELQPQVARRLETRARHEVRVVWPVQAVARAVVNLVRNAAQASNDGDPVIVEGQTVGGGRVRIDVVDRGTGMTSDHLARAGEPFFTTKPAGAGTGLGLFVARSTLEQLGGTLGLTSEPGRGTIATVILPADVIDAAKSS
jgi:two-component system sensor histidine kinase RegB